MTANHNPAFRHFFRFYVCSRGGGKKKMRKRLILSGNSYEAISGEIVQTTGDEHPYKVVLKFAGGVMTEHPCHSNRDAQEFIRKCTPRPRPRDRSRDRPAGST